MNNLEYICFNRNIIMQFSKISISNISQNDRSKKLS